MITDSYCDELVVADQIQDIVPGKHAVYGSFLQMINIMATYKYLRSEWFDKNCFNKIQDNVSSRTFNKDPFLRYV